MPLYGFRRVRITGCVVQEDPLTVMVEPMKEVLEEDKHLHRVLKQGRPKADLDRAVLTMYRPFRKVFKLLEALSNHRLMDPRGQTGVYMDIWERDMSYLPDFGPAVMSVMDRSLHQRALEEPDRSKRLELTIMMLKQQLALDNNIGKELDLHEERLSEEEKELLDQVRRPEKNSWGPQDTLACRGETVIAPSVQMRVRMNKFHGMTRPDVLEKNKKMLKETRMSEHMIGY